MRGNLLANSGLSINRFHWVVKEDNLIFARNDARPGGVKVVLRLNKYDPHRANLAVFNWEHSAKRLTAREFVEKRRKGGDRWIWYVDGLEMLNREQTAGLVDGVHCNSLGFHFNALGLEPFLRKALSLQPVTERNANLRFHPWFLGPQMTSPRHSPRARLLL